MTFLLCWPSPVPSGLAVCLELFAAAVVPSLVGAFVSVFTSCVFSTLVESDAPESAPMPEMSLTEPSACSLEFLFLSSLSSMLSLVLLSPFFWLGSESVTWPLAILLANSSRVLMPLANLEK